MRGRSEGFLKIAPTGSAKGYMAPLSLAPGFRVYCRTMAFFPLINGRTRRNEEDNGQESSAEADSATASTDELIALDLSGAHTEAAALESEPMHVLAHRFRPPEESDLTGLNLDGEP